MSKIIRIIGSPFKDDTDFPWDYKPNDFCNWVWNVFLEGYKHDDIECPTLNEAIGHLRSMGFTVIIDRKPIVLSPFVLY